MIDNTSKILLVDDEPDILEFMAYNLKKEGYTVFTGQNGREAIEIAKKEQPQLIILDIMMPVMDGYEAIKEIRSQERWKKLPIIALTANALAGTREKCIAIGANAYLSKPVDSEMLINALEVWISN